MPLFVSKESKSGYNLNAFLNPNSDTIWVHGSHLNPDVKFTLNTNPDTIQIYI